MRHIEVLIKIHGMVKDMIICMLVKMVVEVLLLYQLLKLKLEIFQLIFRQT